jgi:lipid II:glycine glycyltransferase (peptidoglycan interpeptide bridge formation enzyme)
MTFNVNISSTINENEWNENLCKSSGSTIYQSYNWQKLYHESFDSKPIFITITNDDGIVVGQLACLIHKKMLWEGANTLSKKIGNLLELATSLWWYHGPIIHDKENQNEILSIILSSVDKIAKKHKVANIRGISSPFMTQFPSSLFEKYGYVSEPRLTFVIDLTQDLDELYNSLKKDTRYYIRKSEKEGFEFQIADNVVAMEKFQDLKSEAKKREGEKPFRNIKFWKKHWKIMKNNGFEELILAKNKDRIEGTILVLFFNGNMIQHALANSPDYDLVGTFLTWNTIKWAHKMKYNTFDFAGVDPSPKTKKEKGIYFYAEKFGGEKINFFSYTKIIDQKKYYLSSGLKNPKKILNKIKS